MRTGRGSIAVIVGVLVLFGSEFSSAGTASFQGIGVLPGGFSSTGVAVSADGVTVVGSSRDETFAYQAFRWTGDAGMQPLGFLELLDSWSEAYAVSADGSVIVGISSQGSSLTNSAYRWTADRGMIDLGVLRPDHTQAIAHDTTADGFIIVGVSSPPGSGPGFTEREAFFWIEGIGIVGLGFLPGTGTRSSEANAVTDSSDPQELVIVGRSNSTSAGSEAFRWTLAGGMVGLGFPRRASPMSRRTRMSS